MARKKKDILKKPQEITPQDLPSDDDIRKELEQMSEEEYLKEQKKRNKGYNINLDVIERERVSQYIKDLYKEAEPDQKTLCDKLDEYDAIYRLLPITVNNSDEDTPRHRSPLSMVNVDVTHANVMNVYFTPKEVMRVIPTEKGDIPKVKKLEIFGNWSMTNEMELFKNCDRMFHASAKNGETPYIVHWVKEEGVDIEVKVVMNPARPDEPLLDELTGEPITQEREVTKILYNGPRLEVFARQDYILPKSCMLGQTPPWEMRRVRLSADKVRRNELSGKYYSGVIADIGWEEALNTEKTDTDGQSVPLAKGEQEFIEFYGRMRVNAIKSNEQGEEIYEELEDEFIAIWEPKSETLCSFRKNKFPLKERPIGLDMHIPDSNGRMKGTGVCEAMYPVQQSYDLLHNQFLLGAVQSNNPFGFFLPTGNKRDEKIRIKAGWMYPTSDPNSIKIVEFPKPNDSLKVMMEELRNQSQVMFGISDYSMGVESKIDPSAPAKKAELVVGQGNTRLNLVIRRKNETMKAIFRKWFLLYQANMPPNKFMRIAGEDSQNPWKFEAINMTDFALKSIPDFELTGNVLNSNKQLEVQKVIGIYNLLSQNALFNPGTPQGMQAYHSLTKWMMDKLDETGISGFLPQLKGDMVNTPEEENARFLQGDRGEPMNGEDHRRHMLIHDLIIQDPSIPPEVKKNIYKHNEAHAKLMMEEITQKLLMQSNSIGGMNGTAQPETPGAGGIVQ